jgi:thioredoxin reductase (NADPH)
MDQQVFASKPKPGEAWDVIIIGSGPAALTAAIYTTRGAASTLLLAGEKWGGQLMNTTSVDNFPGFPGGIQGPDLMMNMRKQAERFGSEVIEKNATKVDFAKKPFEVYVAEEKFLGKAVVIATGAETLWLGVPGEKELIGRGISTCAPCDAPFFKDKKVAVIGGGDSAMEEALTLTKYASEVTMIHRRDSFRASEAMQKKILDNPKIKILWNTEVTEVKGKDVVEGLNLKNNQTGESSEIKVDGVFVAIGHRPDSEVFEGQVERDEKGFIKITSPHAKTSIAGVFVAGDVMDPYYKQAITSAGSGCAAALEVLKYLDENSQ